MIVSDDYGRELSGSRLKAVEVEQVNDDPPERISAWLGSIATTALRALDLTLVLDLLQIAKLYTVLDVKDDEASAIASFKK